MDDDQACMASSDIGLRGRRIRPAWVVAMLAILAGQAALAQSPATSQADQWDHEQYFAAYMNNQRIGHLVERERTLADGRIESVMEMRLSIAALGQTVKIVMAHNKTESAEGKPLAFSELRKLGLEPVVREGLIRDGKLALTSRQGDRTLTRTQDWDERVLFTAAARRLGIAKLKADGDEVVVWGYEPDTPGDGFSPTTTRRIGHEEVTVTGQKVRALHVSETNPNWPAAGHSWLNDDFRAVAGQIALGPGAVVRFEACSKAYAHERFAAPEIFGASLIQLDQPFRESEKVRSLRLTLIYKEPLEEPVKLPESARQKVVQSTPERLVVDLTRPDYPASQPDAPGEPSPELKRYLQATERLNAEDPQIVAAAREAIGERTDPLAKARALRDWVDRRLDVKEMSMASGTASEVLRSRRGDCTEHTALLVALARASGIPARSVDGLAYVPRLGLRRDLIGGHEWAQLHVNGQWVDFDAAMPGDPAGVFRLALSIGTADDKTDMASGKGFFRLFSNVQWASVDRVERD